VKKAAICRVFTRLTDEQHE